MDKRQPDSGQPDPQQPKSQPASLGLSESMLKLAGYAERFNAADRRYREAIATGGYNANSHMLKATRDQSVNALRTQLKTMGAEVKPVMDALNTYANATGDAAAKARQGLVDALRGVGIKIGD